MPLGVVDASGSISRIGCPHPLRILALTCTAVPLRSNAGTRISSRSPRANVRADAGAASGLWSGFRAEPNSADINVEAIFSPPIAFLGGTISPALGASISTIGATSDAYLDARWQMETGCGIFLGLGIGGAVHNGQLQLEDWDRKALGSRVLFHFPLEIGYRFDEHNSLSAYFEHMSNAYTVDPNEGLDRLGVRYGYRF